MEANLLCVIIIIPYSLFNKDFLLSIYMYECASCYACAHEYSACGGQNRASHPMELEL